MTETCCIQEPDASKTIKEHVTYDNKPSNPSVSVIIPVYNKEKYLDQCLYTVTNQSLYEIEIICINDGSNDSSLNILNNHANRDPRIQIISHENKGVGKTRNEGI